MLATVEIFDLLEGGQSVGCATRVEFDHWRAEGVFSDRSSLGAVIGREPAAKDEERRKQWARFA